MKSPKLYFRDTGLLHHFLGIRSAPLLDTHPARGASFETFLVDQVISAYKRVAPGSQAYFWRTAQGDEADLLVDLGSRRVPFEIKLHSAPGREDVPGLRRCLHDLDLPRGYVLYPGRERYSLGEGVIALPAEATLARPGEMARL